MSRKVLFRGNTIVLNDEAPELKGGDRVKYTVHDWMEGEHTIDGEFLSLASAYNGGPHDIARVRVGPGIQQDVVHEVPVLALTIVAPVVPLKGGQS